MEQAFAGDMLAYLIELGDRLVREHPERAVVLPLDEFSSPIEGALRNWVVSCALVGRDARVVFDEVRRLLLDDLGGV